MNCYPFQEKQQGIGSIGETVTDTAGGKEGVWEEGERPALGGC